MYFVQCPQKAEYTLFSQSMQGVTDPIASPSGMLLRLRRAKAAFPASIGQIHEPLYLLQLRISRLRM